MTKPPPIELTYWVSILYGIRLPAAEVEEKLRAVCPEAAAIAGLIARGEITDAAASEHEAGPSGNDEAARILAEALRRNAVMFGADAPVGEPRDWDAPEDYRVRVNPGPATAGPREHAQPDPGAVALAALFAAATDVQATVLRDVAIAAGLQWHCAL